MNHGLHAQSMPCLYIYIPHDLLSKLVAQIHGLQNIISISSMRASILMNTMRHAKEEQCTPLS